MPALPWITAQTPGSRVELTVVATRLPLRSHRDTPRFMWHTVRILRQLGREDDLIGYSLLAELPRKTFWTVSAWDSRSGLGRFDRGKPHKGAKDSMRPSMLPSTIAIWTCASSEVPVSWQEVRRRIEAVSLRR
jgi:hypothetical protein